MKQFVSGEAPGNPDLLVPRNREHVWIATAAYRIDGQAAVNGETLHMDRENLATVQHGCYVCECPLSQREVHRKCPGEPRSGS